MTEEERKERRKRRAAFLLLPLMLLGAACCFWSLAANVGLGEAQAFIPAPLHSEALANYGEDDVRGSLRSLSISIIEAVIRDRDADSEDADQRATEVIESMKSPVPTVTPMPGDSTGTPTPPPTTTFTPDPFVTGTSTATPGPSPSPFPLGTATTTNVPTSVPSSTPGPTSTPGPSPTPSATALCYVPPYIEIISPLPDQRFTLAEELPGQAFAFDPDNVDPVTCLTSAGIFPDDDGEGIPGDPEVEMRIEWWNGSSWILVHTELESSEAYCAFGDIDPFCLTHDLSSGFWPDSTPINTGLHRIKAMVLQDDEGVPSGWVSSNFYIDPVPTSTPTSTATPSSTPTPTITPSSTPTPSPTVPAPTATATNTPAAIPVCPDITLKNFDPDAGGNEVSWDIDNSSGATVTLTRIQLTWPTVNAELKWIKLDGTDIWNSDIPPNSMDENFSVAVPPGSWELKIKFEDDDFDTGYNLTVTFDVPCYATATE